MVLLMGMLVYASAAYGAQKIEDIPWDETHIKQLRALDQAAVFRFVTGGDPDGEDLKLSDFGEFEFDWYPAGDGKYELVVRTSTGPEVETVTIYWQEAPSKVRSQDFFIGFFSDHEDAEFADLSRDGKEELILTDPLDDSPELFNRKFVPNGTWPVVYRVRNRQYVEASHEFPSYYENEVLPKLHKEINQELSHIKDVAARKAKPPPGIGPNDDYWQTPIRQWAALTMSRDKILRFVGRDPTAGLAQAREWMTSPDPVLVDDARVVFEDIAGHDAEVHAAEIATERASKNWPNKVW